MKKVLFIGLIFAILFFAGCTGPLEPMPLEKTGKLSLSITDKKVVGLEKLNVTISSVEVHAVLREQGLIADENSDENAGENGAENSGWILFSSEERTFDLMALDSTQGLKELLGEKELSAGKYTQIRLMVKEVKAVINGEEVNVEVPSEKLKIVSNFEIKENQTTELIIDFSPESVIQSGNGYKLKPVIKLLTEKEFKERNTNQNANCAKETERFSKVYTEDYPSECCEGLTEWDSGFDTRISIAGNCYETGLESGNPVGTCINCGNGTCDEREDSCNCPADCSEAEYSDYPTLDDFCSSQFSATIISHCGQLPETDELCALAETCP